jgi:hypothetical protein
LAAAIDPLLAQLHATLNAPTTETSAQGPAMVAAFDPAQSREAAAQLTKLLSEFDPGAADFIEANHAVLQPLFAGGDWSQFAKLVQSYSFADAQARLSQALKK